MLVALVLSLMLGYVFLGLFVCGPPLGPEDLVLVYRRAAQGGVKREPGPLELRATKHGKLGLIDRTGSLSDGSRDLLSVLESLDRLAQLPPPGFLAADADKVDLSWRTDLHPAWRTLSFSAPRVLAARDPRFAELSEALDRLEAAAAAARTPRSAGEGWRGFELPENLREGHKGNSPATDNRNGVK